MWINTNYIAIMLKNYDENLFSDIKLSQNVVQNVFFPSMTVNVDQLKLADVKI